MMALSLLHRTLVRCLRSDLLTAVQRSRVTAAAPVLLLTLSLLALGPVLQGLPGWGTPAGFTVSGDTPPPRAVEGLDTRLIYSSDPAAGVGARWAEIPGNDPFNGELRRAVRAAIDAQSLATGVPFTPSAEAPPGHLSTRTCAPGATTRRVAELLQDPGLTPQTGGPTVTVVCEIVAASGSVFAEALRIVTVSGGRPVTDTTTVYYADPSAGLLATSDGILSDDGVRTLRTRLIQALKAGRGPEAQLVDGLAELPLPALRAWFSNSTLGPDGSLVLRLARGVAALAADASGTVPPPEGPPLFLTVAEVHVAPLLTPVGAAVRRALSGEDPPVLPVASRRGDERVDCSFFACVALTFDDGPGPHTAAVLDALGSRRSAATFFLQGVHVERHPDVVARMHAEGHQIGNHTWNHADLTTLTGGQVADQIGRTDAAIAAATGSAPSVFRPPYGAYDEGVLARAALPAILWSLDTKDWDRPGDAVLLQRAVEGPRPGDIVLLHDVHESTTRMVPLIIDGLLDRGFTLVTVEQVLGGIPSPGTATRR